MPTLDTIPADTRRQVERGISVLRQGGLVAFPTDTVYGLGTRADLAPAVERVYTIKKRPRSKGLPLLLSHVSQIGEVAYPVPETAWLLARRFLPGALTLVLCKSNFVSDTVAAGATVAIRVPAHPIPAALVESLGVPVVGTSANLSGLPSLLAAEEVRAQLGNRIDLVIDGGPNPDGRESTVVDVTGEMPVVLREGAISVAELERVCGGIMVKERS
jgi:L-threonylcarbamoyladenylate synthase